MSSKNRDVNEGALLISNVIYSLARFVSYWRKATRKIQLILCIFVLVIVVSNLEFFDDFIRVFQKILLAFLVATTSKYAKFIPIYLLV